MNKEQFSKSCQYHARKQSATRIGISLEEYEARIASNQKWCGKCRTWKHLTLFDKDKNRASGYSSRCKECRSKQCSTYWKKLRLDPIRLEQKRSRERRAGRRSNSTRSLPRVPKYIRDMRWEEYDGLCAYCGSLAETFDHIIPVSKGGKNQAWNIAPACRSCNSSKQDTDLFEWVDRYNLNPCWQLWEQIANVLSAA